MGTAIRPVAEVNKKEPGLEPTEMEANLQKGGLEFRLPNLSAITAAALCEQLVPHRAFVAVHTPYSRWLFLAPRKANRYSVNLALFFFES